MTWYAFKGLNDGKAIDLAGYQEKVATVDGFHGYDTEADAEAHPNTVNAVSRIVADGFIADYKAALAGGSQPGGPNASDPLGAAAQTAKTEAGNIPGLADIGDFFHRLTESNTWLRIGEGLLGIVLIAVGLAKLTGAVPVATKIARMV